MKTISPIALSEMKMFRNNLSDFFKVIDQQFRSPDPMQDKQKLYAAEAELYSHAQILNLCSLFSISDPKGRVIYANDKFCEVSGYTFDELYNKPHSIVRHPDTPAHVFKEMWSTIGNGKVWQGELKNKAKNGSAYWVLATVSPVLGEDGKPIRYISVRVDITKQKLAEEALQEAKTKIDHELLENIDYAKYIHSSFLTPEEELKAAFPESFLIYHAQKIISGDFYKVERRKDKSIIVLGDSTGHGVSASYISVMALNVLSRIMENWPDNPFSILKDMDHELNRIIHLNKKTPIIETADMIVCCIDHKKMILKYASARMRGVIMRGEQLIELERDSCTIGAISDKQLPLTNKEILLQHGDILYLFTDGVADQFGGPNDKRFNYKHLYQVINENSNQPMWMQRNSIVEALTEWKGNHDQTDDMTLLGLKIV